MTGEIMAMQYVALAFAAVLALAWIVMKLSAVKPADRKGSRIFACGMEVPPEKLNVPPGGYYSHMKSFFRTGMLARMHSGRLSSYVAWIMVGMALIVAVLVMSW